MIKFLRKNYWLGFSAIICLAGIGFGRVSNSVATTSELNSARGQSWFEYLACYTGSDCACNFAGVSISTLPPSTSGYVCAVDCGNLSGAENGTIDAMLCGSGTGTDSFCGYPTWGIGGDCVGGMSAAACGSLRLGICSGSTGFTFVSVSTQTCGGSTCQ